MKRSWLICLLVLFSRDLGAQAQANCRSQDTVYFAGTALEDRESWYGRALLRMRESRLCPEEGVVAFRFLWLRSFHRPVAVRVTKTERGGRIWLRVLSGAGGYDPGKVVEDRSFEITKAQWDSIAGLMINARFWDLPTVEPFVRVDTVNGQVLFRAGADGAHWVLEVVDGARYHIVDRWTPGTEPESRPFYDVCRYLLTLSRLRLHPDEIY